MVIELYYVTHPAEVLRAVVDESEGVLGEGVEDVEAVDLVALGDGEVEGDEGERVGLGDAQRRVQRGDEVGHLVEADELRGVGVVPEGEGRREASIIGHTAEAEGG